MKKIPKILVAISTGLVLILASVLSSGCGGNSGGNNSALSFKEYNLLVKSAATDFYSAHTEYETFQNITYRWTEHEVNKENVTMEYKENATDEEMVSGTFLNHTVTDATYAVAVKKGDGKLIGQLTVNSTTTTDTYDIKEDDTLDHIVSTTVESKTYRLLTVAGESSEYYLIYESSTKTDEEDAAIEKKYKTLTQPSDYDNLMDGYMVKQPNKIIKNAFFDFSELFIIYSSFMTVEKNGNRVSLSFGYEEMPEIAVGTGSYDISIVNMLQKIVFENGKIFKSEVSSKQSSKDFEFEKSIVFDFVNVATVDDSVDFTDFTEDTTSSFTNGFTDAIDHLPSVGMFS